MTGLPGGVITTRSAEVARRYGGAGVRAGTSLASCRGLPAGVNLACLSISCGEVPVKRERTYVGLDVHARSVVGCGLDGDTGELVRARLCPQHEAVWDWLRQLPGPVAVTYEAGPTGFGLARFLRGPRSAVRGRCPLEAAAALR